MRPCIITTSTIYPTVQHRYFCFKYCPNVTDFLTTGISVAGCERSFSKLKLIKNYLRSTMSDARLYNLAILSIERELADEIDSDYVISEFAARKTRKIRL